MVQEFHVLRCFSCETFQVQQVKKVNKWSCKVCGLKQSVIKEFGRGSGADCRRHVQKLNAARGLKMETASGVRTEGQLLCPTQFHEEEQYEHEIQMSRWDKYLPQKKEGLMPEGEGPGGEAEPEQEIESEEVVVMDRDQLNFRKHRPNRPKPYSHHQKTMTLDQDATGPPSSSRVRSSPHIPRTPSTSSTPSTPSAFQSKTESKWSAFVEKTPVSKPCSGFSGSSLFQSGEDLDLNLDWL